MMESSIKPEEEDDNYSKSDTSDQLYKQVRTDTAKTNNQPNFDMISQSSTKSMSYRGILDRAQLSSQISDINSRLGFSSQASEYRKAFSHFQRLIQNSEQTVQRYNVEFSRNLNIKTQNVLDSKGLGEYFERQLFKMAGNSKQVRKNWSEDETLLLLSLMAYFCCLYNEDFMNLSDKAWLHISAMFPGKTPEQLKLRWQNVLKVPLNKEPWSKKEDEMLEELVKERGSVHWKEIAMELHSRSGSQQFRQIKQVRDRWNNFLDPSIKKGGWTNREDVILLREYVQRGKKWPEIAKLLPGRTEMTVKNRWLILLKKYKPDLTLEEAAKITEDFENEELLNIQIARTLIELKERDLSAASSEGIGDVFSMISEDKAASSESGDREKELGSNLKHKEYRKHNQFMADKLLESFSKEKDNSISDEGLFGKNNFVVQDSFKDLIAWQNNNIEGKPLQGQSNQQIQSLLEQPQQSNLLLSGTGGGQNQNLFANLSMNNAGLDQTQNLFSNQTQGQFGFQAQNYPSYNQSGLMYNPNFNMNMNQAPFQQSNILFANNPNTQIQGNLKMGESQSNLQFKDNSN